MKGSKKKFFTRMTKDEIDIARALARRRFTYSEHAEEEMRADRITRHAVEDTIDRGQVIEVSTHPGRYKLRVLLRLDGVEDEKSGNPWLAEEDKYYSCCAVVELGENDNEVITVYRNALDDTHTTEKYGDYDWTDDVVNKAMEVIDP